MFLHFLCIFYHDFQGLSLFYNGLLIIFNINLVILFFVLGINLEDLIYHELKLIVN